MKYNKSKKIIQNISASFSAIVTGFVIGLFLFGLLGLIPLVNTVNAQALSVSCSVSTTTPSVGGTVTWLSDVSGGTGSYTFSWSGTESLTGSSGTVNKAYTTTGVKTASVSITSGGSSASCSSSITVTDVPVPDPDPDPTPDPAPSPVSSGGGGGGGTIITFKIRNEKVERIATSTALVTWDTNLQAQSRVFFDTTSRASSTLPFVEYATSTLKTDLFVTGHSMTITGLNLGMPYYFRPAAYRFGDVVNGVELSLASIGEKEEAITSTTAYTAKLAEPALCSEYLLNPIKLGVDNDISEVLKLQVFLNDFEDFDLNVTGVYNIDTYNAVKTFQEKYSSDILEPWDMDVSTGYVYITTMKKINEIYCNKFIDFALDDLTQEEQKEVLEFRDLLKSLQEQGLPIPEDLIIGVEDTVSDTVLAVDSTSKSVITDSTDDASSMVASVIGSEDSQGENGAVIEFFNSIKNIFKVLYNIIF